MSRTVTLGRVAMDFKGEYSSLVTYEKMDVVSKSGSSYVAKSETTGNDPTNTTYWELIASKGDTGDTGPTGPAGATGETGSTGLRGEQGSQGFTFTPQINANGDLSWTNNGNLTNPTLVNIKGPKGDTGETGLTGPAGQDGRDGRDGQDGQDGQDGSGIVPDLVKDIAETKSAHIEDSEEGCLKNVEIFGESTQATRSGKNKFNFSRNPEWIYGSTEYVKTNEYIEVTNNGSRNYAFVEYYLNDLDGNTQYTLSYDFVKTTGSVRASVCYPRNTGAITVLGTATNDYTTNKGELTFTTPANTSNLCLIIYSLIGSYYANADVKYSNIQLEEGTTATDYELYGAMPSVEFPSGITNKTGNQNITATAHEPYVSQNNVLPLGDIELCKLQNEVRDRVYKGTDDKRYHEQNIGKETVNGTTATISAAKDNAYYMCTQKPAGQLTGKVITFDTAVTNAVVYYELATPVTTEITDTDIISVLEGIKTYYGVTNITSNILFKAQYYTNTEMNRVFAKKEELHSHSNKSVLDQTQESFTTTLKNKLDGLSNYTLPAPTGTALGGVKAGSNITIDVDGTINAELSGELAEASNYNNVTNKPQIAGITLQGNKTLADLGITDTTYSEATTSTDGLMSSEDKTKLNGIEASANNYTHPTTSGNKHIPSGGASGKILVWSSDGTATWEDNNYVHPTTSGNKHIPSGGSSGKVLKWSSDGTATWEDDSDTTYSEVTASTNGLMSSTDKSKLDGIATNANNYTHPTTAGNKHIPAGGSSGQILKYSSAGTAEWSSDLTSVTTTSKSLTIDGVTIAFTFYKCMRFVNVITTITWNDSSSATFDNSINIANNLMPYGDTNILHSIPANCSFVITNSGKLLGWLDDPFGEGSHSYTGYAVYMSKE